MSSNVDRIKERLSIIDVVESYLKLEKSGSNFKAKCPFHSEKTPSFFVSPDRGTFYCFGCQAKGDIFTFVQEFEGLDFPGALKVLALRAGIELKKENLKSRSEKERMIQIMETTTLFFEQRLGENKEAINYLKKRGLKEKTLKDWRTGFAPSSWQETLSYLKEKGFNEEEIKKAGLAKEVPEKKGRLYDVFRGRIMFPIFDQATRPIAFSGRLLVDEENAPKYLNSPETLLFNKSEVLYGLEKAKSDIRKKNYSILVEGQIDLLLSHQEGFTNTVASSGTALTLSQLSRLNRLSSRIIFAYDGDKAGLSAVQKSAKLALSLGMNVKVAPVPSGEDPASLISQSQEKYLNLLKNSLHIIDFHLSQMINAKLPQRRVDQELKKKVLPFVKLLPSSIDQARFISEIAEKTSLREQAIWEDLKRVPDEETTDLEEQLKSSSVLNKKELIVSKIIGIILWQESLGKDKKIDTKKIKERLVEIVGKETISNLQDKTESIFEAEAYYDGRENLDLIIEDLLVNLEEEVLRWQFGDVMRKLSLAEKAKDKEKTKILLDSCGKISEKINNLNFQKTRRFLKL